jgi:transcriptional regulator with XRE-family HTH domain
MLGGPLIKIARQRAGLTQRELAERLGLPQSNIARWESGARQPTIDNFVEAVRACGLDPVVELFPLDRSNDAFIWELLDEPPARRLQMQLAAAEGVRRATTGVKVPFDPLRVVRAFERGNVDYVLLGTLAENLRGSPLLPVAAEVAICPDSSEANLARLRTVLGELDATQLGKLDRPRQFPTAERWTVEDAGAVMAILRVPAGTTGFGDLSRNATEEDLDRGLNVRVAALIDLFRIADASVDSADRAVLPTLRRAHELSAGYVPREQRKVTVPAGLEDLFARHGIHAG